jgi:hypothetical protein
MFFRFLLSRLCHNSYFHEVAAGFSLRYRRSLKPATTKKGIMTQSVRRNDMILIFKAIVIASFMRRHYYLFRPIKRLLKNYSKVLLRGAKRRSNLVVIVEE